MDEVITTDTLLKLLSACRRIGKITTEIDPKTLRTDKVVILLDQ